MPVTIQVLPDHIANQIAAGEVIQRPASAVKELLENAVDAGATEIRLIVLDAGKTLVQVVDNGSGMSAEDAARCFGRHATSKIRTIEDLFHIRSMGFRGEALASIAAVAQVELKTRQPGDPTGTYVEVENSTIRRQEPVATAEGTSLAMKNLFFNIPARRNFLKSNPTEMRHIVDEFTRVALAFPGIFFSLTANDQQLFHLEAGSLKQRIIQLLGSSYNARIVAVREETDYMNIHGFVGKPDTAKRNRGDQYFFVNNRFIRSAYLNHAVMSAYQELIPADSYPMYALFIDLDPAQVDVNVHPTKQEIKFDDEKIVYAFVQAAVKHALAQFSITPTLDFDLDASIQQLSAIQQPFTEEKKSAAAASALFRGFTEKHQAHLIEPANRSETRSWKRFFEPAEQAAQVTEGQAVPFPALVTEESGDLVQVLNTYLVAGTRQGIYVIHQQAAHERILYEQLSQALKGRPVATQRSLFPVTLELNPADAVVMEELLGDLQLLGFLVEPVGRNSFVVQGRPADVTEGNEKAILESLLEQYRHFTADLQYSGREKLLRSMATQRAIRPGTPLSQREMKSLVADLFACATPNAAPDGRPTYLRFSQEQLAKLFAR